MEGMTLPQSFLDRRLYHTFEDDFDYLDDSDRYTKAGASVAAVERLGGGLDLTTGAIANNEAYLHNTNETLKLGRPLYWGTEVAFTDASANSGALCVGLVDGAAAALVVDGGAALRAGNIDCAMFVKYTDQAYWTVVTQRGGVATREANALTGSNKNNLTNVVQNVATTRQRLEIEGFPVNSGYEVVFKIDGVVVAKHINIDVSAATEVQPVWFAKTTTANAQTLSAYYNQGRIKR